jgi:hypothetical protein
MSGLLIVALVVTLGITFVAVTGIVANHVISTRAKSAESGRNQSLTTTTPTISPSWIPTQVSSNLVSTSYTDFPTAGLYGLDPMGLSISGQYSDDTVSSVSLSYLADRVAVGSSQHSKNDVSRMGRVCVYERKGTNDWILMGGECMSGRDELDMWGAVVSLSSNGRVVAASAGNPNVGHVRIFDFAEEDGIWKEKGQDLVGFSVSLSEDGGMIALGGNTTAQVYRYNLEGNVWKPVGEGENSNVKENGHCFVALSGDGTRVAVGSPFDRSTGPNHGRLRIFQVHSSVGLVQVGQTWNGRDDGGQFGKSVALSYNGAVVAVGAPSGNLVKVLEYKAGSWVQRGADINGGYSQFGWAVSLDNKGDMLGIGSPLYSRSRGRALIYQFQTNRWQKITHDVVGLNSNEYEGWDISISPDGGFVAIAAKKADHNGFSANGRVSVFGLIG